MAFADPIRTKAATMEGVATLLESVLTTPSNLVSSYWLPSVSVTAPFTLTGVSITKSQYFRIGDMVLYMIDFSGTAGGTLGGIIDFTLPVTSDGTTGAASIYITNNSIIEAGTCQLISSTQARVRRDGAAAVTAGTVGAVVYGFYEAA